jgi:DUF4097 and DUF4098 domain-containing protein YvlB
MKTIGKVTLVLSVICIISFGLAAGLFFLEEDYIRYSFDNSSVQINDLEKSLIEGITEIEVNSQSTDSIVEVIDSEEVVFNLTGDYTKGKYTEDIELSLNKEGGKIIVDVVYKKPRMIFGFNNQDLDLYVGIPENYSGDLKLKVHSGEIEIPTLKIGNLVLESNSGKINFEDVDSNSVEVKSNSGSIYGTNVKSEVVELIVSSGSIDISQGKSDVFLATANSGKIEINNFTGEEARISTSSGGIDLDNLNFNELNVQASSGKIEIENSFVSSASTSSGGINLEGILIDRDLNLKSSSGRVSVNYLDRSSFILETEIGSGSLHKDFEGLIFEEGDNNVFVQTGPGSVYLNRF